MKIFFALLVIVVFGFNFLAAQDKNKRPTDRERADLRGALKKVETYQIQFLSSDNKIIEQKRPWFTSIYNADGSRAEHISYFQDGRISKDVYVYNTKGENVECKTFYTDFKNKNLTRVQSYFHTFDAQGNLIERDVIEDDGSRTARFVYQYDDKGNKIEDRNYYHTGALGGKTISTYNDHGKLTSEVHSNADGAVVWKQFYVVNNKGQTTEQTTYRGNLLKYKITFAYDDKGRIRQKETSEFNAVPNTWTSHAPEPGKIVFIYDDEKRTKEQIKFNTDGYAAGTTLTVYDEKGVEIEAAWYEGGGTFSERMQSKHKTPDEQRRLRGNFKGKRVYQYEYDAHGNWTKKIYLNQSLESEQPKPSGGEQRIITYY